MRLRSRVSALALTAVTSSWLGLCRGEANGTTTPEDALTASLAQLPSCAISCLLNSVTEAGCQPTEAQCVCEDKYVPIEQNATPCIVAACELSDVLITKRLTDAACNRPIRNKSKLFNVLNIIGGTVAAVIVIIRLVFKRFFSLRRELAPDDWVIFASLFIGIPGTAINSLGLTAHGLGRDVWTLTPQMLARFGEYFYIMETVYLSLISVIKLSISLFYLAIFPARGIRHLLMGTAIFNGIFGFTFAVLAIFQCTPISYFWTRYVDKTAPGRCIDMNLAAWIHAGFNIAIDLWMLAVPLSQIRKLKLHWKKKIGITIMFLLGTIVTVISILRLRSLVTFSNSTNPTYDQLETALWSNLEVNIGVICACLPALRLILVRIAPRVFSTETTSSRSERTPQGQSDSMYRRHSRVIVHKMVEFTSFTTTLGADADEREDSDTAVLRSA